MVVNDDDIETKARRKRKFQFENCDRKFYSTLWPVCVCVWVYAYRKCHQSESFCFHFLVSFIISLSRDIYNEMMKLNEWMNEWKWTSIIVNVSLEWCNDDDDNIAGIPFFSLVIQNRISNPKKTNVELKLRLIPCD